MSNPMIFSLKKSGEHTPFITCNQYPCAKMYVILEQNVGIFRTIIP